MNKEQATFGSIILSFLIYLSLMLSHIINTFLLTFKLDVIFSPIKLILNLSNKKTLMIFILLVISSILFMIYAVFANRISNIYNHNMKITDDIYTPIYANNGQHGTARWLKNPDNAFESVTIADIKGEFND